MENKTLIEKIISIQSELKATKDKFNRFGNYAYRSAEGILESVKPLLKKEGVVLTITDEIVLIGAHFYVKATATLTDGKETLSTSAFAREEEVKKGMDAAQITGSASSYARKYALNGLLCIDDGKDADTDEYHKQQNAAPQTAQNAANVVISKEVVDAVQKAGTLKDLVAIWNANKPLQAVSQFVNMFSERKKQLTAK